MELTNKQYKILQGGIVGGCASLLFFMFQSIQISNFAPHFTLILSALVGLIGGVRILLSKR